MLQLCRTFVLGRRPLHQCYRPGPIYPRQHLRYQSFAADVHRCDVDAEPLQRYKPGGYHPVHLGDVFHGGRYTIVHKLGWGSFSTIWAARDSKAKRNVAIKVCVADTPPQRELRILEALSAASNDASQQHVVQLLDHFLFDGPNGTHSCLVLEMLGPSISDLIQYRFDDCTPAPFAKQAILQFLQALDFLSRADIGHGDLHTRNVAVQLPGIQSMDENALLQVLDTPETAPVRRLDGKPLDSSVPSYLVWPAPFRRREIIQAPPVIKIIDFGEAFFADDAPRTLHTPLSVRAPEVLFGDALDKRVDLWSAACLIFELVSCQTLFSSIMATPPVVVHEMTEYVKDTVPERWQEQCEQNLKEYAAFAAAYATGEEGDAKVQTLQEMFEQIYFDGPRTAKFRKKDVRAIGKLVAQLLKFEPGSRATARDLLDDPWFQ